MDNFYFLVKCRRNSRNVDDNLRVRFGVRNFGNIQNWDFIAFAYFYKIFKKQQNKHSIFEF